MKLLLDTANLKDVQYFSEHYPIVGVTTNPTILSREGGDAVAHLGKIRALIGPDRQLHVQALSSNWEDMIAEAKAIVARFGKNTFVKLPATPDGLRATAALASEGYGITVTAVLSAGQAMLAANAGAAYVAPYVSRLDNMCEDGVATVANIAEILEREGSDTQILAASFKTARSVIDVATAGAQNATVAADVLKKLLEHPATDVALHAFDADWKRAFGDTTFLQLLG